MIAAVQQAAQAPLLSFSQCPLQVSQVPVKHVSHSGGATVSFSGAAADLHPAGSGLGLQQASQESLSSARQATPRRLHGGAPSASFQQAAQAPTLLVSQMPLQLLQEPVQHDWQSGLSHWSPAGVGAGVGPGTGPGAGPGVGPGAGPATIRTSPHCCQTCVVCSQSYRQPMTKSPVMFGTWRWSIMLHGDSKK